MTTHQAPGDKLLGLEALRFVCAFAVLVWHYQHFSYAGSMPVDLVREQQPFYGLFAWFYERGTLAVPLFWAISGYVFSWKYAADIMSGRVTGGRFFVLRFSRLYPLHLATLLVVALLQQGWMLRNGTFLVYPANTLPVFGLHLLMASNWVEPGYSFNGPIWSVSVEVLVYALFFCAFRLVRRPTPVALAFIGLGIALRLMRLDSAAADCAMYFFMGVLTAHVAGLAWVRRHMVPATLVALAAFGLSMMAARYREFLAITFGIPLAVHLCANLMRVPRPLAKPVQAAANLTYALYLTHFPIQLLLMTLMQLTGIRPDYREPALFLVFIASTFAVSAAIFRAFEMPAQDWLRSRLLGQRRLAAAAG